MLPLLKIAADGKIRSLARVNPQQGDQ